MKLTFLFLVCGFILFGCKSASTDLPEIILSLNAPEIQVKELYQNTTEEDNPILLIGECKP